VHYFMMNLLNLMQPLILVYYSINIASLAPNTTTSTIRERERRMEKKGSSALWMFKPLYLMINQIPWLKKQRMVKLCYSHNAIKVQNGIISPVWMLFCRSITIFCPCISRTLTAPVKLIKCLKTIKEYAFCASEYLL